MGNFRGSDIEPSRLDALLAHGLTKGDLEDARSLFATKWWDYRYVHPGYCLLLFSDLYVQKVDEWRSKFGVNPYAKMRCDDGPFIRTARETTALLSGGGKSLSEKMVERRDRKVLVPQAYRTGLWRAMCHADAHGIPYDRYLSLAFEFAFEHQWKRIPHPATLYSTQMVRFIVDRFDDEKKEIMSLPKDPRFTAAQYQGHIWQDQFQDWLLELISKRPVPVIPLTQYVARERLLVPRRAAKRFGEALIREAVARARA